MFQNFIHSNLVKGSKVLGVDLFINSDGTFDISAMILTKEKGKLIIDKKFTGLKQIKDLEDKSIKGLPVCLSIDGKGILFKKVEIKSKQKLIHQLLPNAKESDFVIQKTDTGKNEQFIVAVRTEVLNTIIDSINELGIFITNCYLGPYAIKNILSLVHSNVVYTSHHVINLGEDTVDKVERLAETKMVSYKLGDEEVYSDDLLMYASALAFFIDFENEDRFEKVAETKQEFLFKQLFTLTGWFALAFFFVLLLVNYLFFNQYNKKLNSANFRYNQNLEMIKKLDTLKSEYALKEQYFVSSGFLDASEQSFYADRIANSVPSDIQLTSLNINPLDGKFKNDKPLNFMMGKIRITGNVTQSIILNNWVKKVKSFDWVERVTIIDYLQESQENPAIFELEIEMK
ncbi:MAG: hypothetical protein KQH79_12875 [Bacteroidetes bacterium]|nr:hypothetical protein [Bacteroidota bacterium]